MLLAGDIGGTKTDLAIFSVEGGRIRRLPKPRRIARTTPVCRRW